MLLNFTLLNRKQKIKYLINTIAALIFFPVIDKVSLLLSNFNSGDKLNISSSLIILLGLLEIIWLLKFSYDSRKTQMKKAQNMLQKMKSLNQSASKEDGLKK